MNMNVFDFIELLTLGEIGFMAKGGFLLRWRAYLDIRGHVE